MCAMALGEDGAQDVCVQWLWVRMEHKMCVQWLWVRMEHKMCVCNGSG